MKLLHLVVMVWLWLSIVSCAGTSESISKQGLVYDVDKLLFEHQDSIQQLLDGHRDKVAMNQGRMFLAEFGTLDVTGYPTAKLLLKQFNQDCSSSSSDVIECMNRLDVIVGYILEERVSK